MKKLLWIFFIGICFAQSGQNFLKKTEVGDSINAHLTNYADKPEMMDSILANAGTVSGLPDTALVLRQVIIDSSNAIRADMGDANISYIDSVDNLKLDKSALKDSINSRNLVYEPELDDSVLTKLNKSALKDSINARNLVYEPELDDSISSVRQVIIDSTASVTQNLADSMNTIMMLSEVIDSMKAAIADTLKSTYIVPSNVNGNLSISASTSLNMTSVDIKVFGNIEFNNTVSFFDTLEIPFGIKLGSFPSTDGIIKNIMSNRVSKFYGGSLTNSGAMFLYGQSHSTKPKFIELLTGNTVRQSISGTGIVSFTSDTVKNSGVFSNTGFVNSTAGYLHNGTNINTIYAPIASPTFTGTLTAPTLNGTSDIQLNGTSINTTGTLTNVAYKGQDNSFSVNQTISNPATTATKICLVNGSFTPSATGIYFYNNSSTAINPTIAGYGSVTGLNLVGYTTDDASTNVGLNVSARKIGSTTISEGRAFLITNYTTELLSVNYNGKTKIGTGTATEALDVTGNIKASGTVTAPTLNGTSAFQLNGTDINTTGTLTNVAYKGQDNNFTVTQTIGGNIVLTNAADRVMLINTSDGSDNRYLGLSAGSALSSARSAYIRLDGNEVASSGGRLMLFAGNVATTGRIQFHVAGSATGQMNLGANGYLFIGSGTTEATEKLEVGSGNAKIGGTVTATQFKLSALNTAPASASATGSLGEIRIVDGYIYVCVATNTWKRAAIATW